jgi:hypothetical protein
VPSYEIVVLNTSKSIGVVLVVVVGEEIVLQTIQWFMRSPCGIYSWDM